MRIVLNGEQHDVEATELQGVLLECGYQSEKLATALNGVFVHRESRAATRVSEGDRIEVVAPIEGG